MSTDMVVVLFSMANALRGFAYVPQIVMLMRDDTGAASISCSTWSLVLVARVTTVIYALAEKQDAGLAIVFSLNAIIWRRRNHPPSTARLNDFHRTEAAHQRPPTR